MAYVIRKRPTASITPNNMAKGLTLEQLQGMGAKPVTPVKGLTLDQIKAQQSATPLNGFATTNAKQMPAGQKAAMGIYSDIYKRGEDVIDTVTRGADALQDPKLGVFGKTKALLSTGLQTAGAAAGGALDIIKGVTKSTAQTLIPDAVSKPVKSAFGSAISAIGDIPVVYGSDKTISDEAKFAVAGIKHLWDSLDPETQRNLEAAGNIGAILLANKTSPDVPTKEATKAAFKTIPEDIGKAKASVVASIKEASVKAKESAKDLPGVRNYIDGQAQERADAARAIVEGNVSDARTAKYSISDKTFQKTYKDIQSSDSTELFDKAIKEGSLKADEVYSSGKILTPDAASGRIDDVAQKLDNLEDGLGAKYRTELAGKELTMENIVKSGEETLNKAVSQKLSIDPLAKEAIKQGIDEGDVALIKSSSVADRAKGVKMVEIGKKMKTDTIFEANNRVSEEAGRTFNKPVDFIIKTNKEAAKSLDKVAKAELTGKPVDLSKAYTQYVDDLTKHKVDIDEKGLLDFDNSDYVDLPDVQKSLNTFHKRFTALEAGDGYDAHQVKRFIDEQVTYGGNAQQGLKGSAKTIAKNFRHNVDEALDTTFPAYDKVNTQFSETKNFLDELEDMAKVPLGDSELLAAKSGMLFRRINSNSPNWKEFVRLIANTEGLAKKYGYVTDESVLHQVLTANMVEDMLKIAPQYSLAGQTKLGVENAARALGAVKDVSQGNLLGAASKIGEEAYNVARGISDEAKIEALKKLLGE